MHVYMNWQVIYFYNVCEIKFKCAFSVPCLREKLNFAETIAPRAKIDNFIQRIVNDLNTIELRSLV